RAPPTPRPTTPRPASPTRICLREKVMSYQFAEPKKMRDFLTCEQLPRAGFRPDRKLACDIKSRRMYCRDVSTQPRPRQVSSAARQATNHERIVGGTGSLCHSAQRYASPHIQPEAFPCTASL